MIFMKKSLLIPAFLSSILALSLSLDQLICQAGDLRFSDPSFSVQPPTGAVVISLIL